MAASFTWQIDHQTTSYMGQLAAQLHRTWVDVSQVYSSPKTKMKGTVDDSTSTTLAATDREEICRSKHVSWAKTAQWERLDRVRLCANVEVRLCRDCVRRDHIWLLAQFGAAKWRVKSKPPSHEVCAQGSIQPRHEKCVDVNLRRR